MPTLSRIIKGALLSAIVFVLFGLFGHFQITLDRTQIHHDRPPIDPASKREEVWLGLDRLPFLREMRDRGLDLSRRQQQKFFSVKDLIIPQVIRNPRYRHLYRDDERNGRYFAYILNERFAFRHIFKNGGSAVEAQIDRKQVNRRDIGSRRLVAVVRDPVEHFLSGWAECGSRNNLAETKPKEGFDSRTYDTRIKRWLSVVMKTVDFNEITSHQKRFYRCRAHSFPQANFLLLPLHDSKTNTRGNGTFPQLDLVGDLRELPAVLTLTGFRWSMTMGREINRTNVAENNADKQQLYPKRVDLLANGTLKILCSFLSLDYYLFAFDPPPVCRDNLTLPLLNLVAETF